METQISELGQIIQHLIILGEDRDELLYWQSVYEDLSPEQQQELYQNLEQELQALNK
jgi:hypothetical protein